MGTSRAVGKLTLSEVRQARIEHQGKIDLEFQIRFPTQRNGRLAS